MDAGELASIDVPQANDPERIWQLACHITRNGTDTWPPDFEHPRDRHFYRGALRALRALDDDGHATDALGQLAVEDPDGARVAFAAVFGRSPVGHAWLMWAGATRLDDLAASDPVAFLQACASLSESTARRRASTLRRWLAWCTTGEPAPQAPQPDEPPPPIPRRAPPPAERTAPRDAHRLLAGLARDAVALELRTVDLCFVAALYLRADRASLTSFEADALVDVFEQVCDLVEPGAENPAKRATHAIQRLRDQRMLARVDGGGISHTGEYALTRLAAAVVEYFLADETLTRESLVLLTRTLQANLADVRSRARIAEDPDTWAQEVIAPLRVTVGDLVAGIERRQRGLDAQQEEVQHRIGELLKEDWFDAIERCQALLDATTDTLRELNEVLLRDAHQLTAVLQDIQALATERAIGAGEEAAQRVIEHVDRIAEWGAARQRAWSEYYQYVHRFLQDVVRLDPDRALSARLRDQIAGWPERPFHLVAADAPSIRLLRPVDARVERPPVRRDREDREHPPEWVDAEDQRAHLEDRVRAALAEGRRSLADITRHVLADLPEPQHYGAAGRIASIVADLTLPRAEREPSWTPVTPTLEIEQWALLADRSSP